MHGVSRGRYMPSRSFDIPRRIPAPRPPPYSKAVVKRTPKKGRGLFAGKRGILARSFVAFYPCQIIHDPGPNSGHPLKAFFVAVEQDDTLVASPFSDPAHRQPVREVPFM